MSTIEITEAPLQHSDSFFIGGEWVEPSSKRTIDVIDSTTEELYFSVPEALEPDMDRAIAAAREAFDHGPWRKLPHAERATYMKALAAELRKRADDIAQIWPRESGVIHQPGARAPPTRPPGPSSTTRASPRRFPLRGREGADGRAASSGCSSASRSAWSARSSPGTRRSADRPQGRPGAGRRLHGRPEVLAGGAR